MAGEESGVSVQEKWWRLGVYLTMLHFAFLLLVIVLLQIDVYIAVIVAALLSILGGIGITVFVLRYYH